MTKQRLIDLQIEGGTAIVSLQRPAAQNAINRELLSELGANLAMLAGRHDLRVVLLRGEGPAFAAGADMSELASLDPAQAEQLARLGQRIFTALENLPQPTIALVHGAALGGGLELALACDVRIAAEDAEFGQPAVWHGAISSFGGSQRLPRIVGQGRALSMLLTGDPIDAKTALSAGLVQEVVPAAALCETGLAWADKLQKLDATALHYTKRAVYEGAELDLSKGQALEASLFGLCHAATRDAEHLRAVARTGKN